MRTVLILALLLALSTVTHAQCVEHSAHIKGGMVYQVSEQAGEGTTGYLPWQAAAWAGGVTTLQVTNNCAPNLEITFSASVLDQIVANLHSDSCPQGCIGSLGRLNITNMRILVDGKLVCPIVMIDELEKMTEVYNWGAAPAYVQPGGSGIILATTDAAGNARSYTFWAPNVGLGTHTVEVDFQSMMTLATAQETPRLEPFGTGGIEPTNTNISVYGATLIAKPEN